MNRQNEPIDWQHDPVVEEVRRARRELWRQAGGTVDGLMRLVAERESGGGSATAPPAQRGKRSGARMRKSRTSR